MIAFWEECIQNAFSAFWEECIQNAFSAKTKNQDSPRAPEQIFEFPNQNQEPRTKIPQRLLNKSWNFWTKTKNQDSPKTPEQILVLGS